VKEKSIVEKELDALIPSLVEQYRRGAIVFDFGLQDEVQAMQKAGLGLLKQALQALDTYGPAGRLSLLPLLDDSEPGARVNAADELLELEPERALKTLVDLANNERGHTACEALSIMIKYLDKQEEFRRRAESESPVTPGSDQVISAHTVDDVEI
jgi:hypothetical protein